MHQANLTSSARLLEAAPPAMERNLASLLDRQARLQGQGAYGPLGGGLLFDRFGSCVWLHVGSLILGPSAAAMLATFPPGPAAGGGEARPVMA